MRKIFCTLLSMSLLSLLPNPLLADGVDFSGYNSYVLEGENKIVFYRGPIPVAVVTLQTCKVPSAADVQVTKSYMCDSDTIFINGEKCAIMSLDSISSQ